MYTGGGGGGGGEWEGKVPGMCGSWIVVSLRSHVWVSYLKS